MASVHPDPADPTVPGVYESPKLLGEYLLLHYGDEETHHSALPIDEALAKVPFPVRCVRELLDRSILPPHARALEVGCAVGAAAFELSLSCTHVEASDYSNSFISAAQTLQREGSLAAVLTVEGDITTPFMAQVPKGIDRSRVNFSVADATNLPEDLGSFDVVLAANLICRLPDPDAFLSRAGSLLNPGGQLLLTTPFTWLEEYTSRDRWLGGIDRDHRSEQELMKRLSGDFRLHTRRNLPFLIREHERKYQLGIALGTCWIRN